MKHFRAKILVLCALMAMGAASLGPFVVEASCPDALIGCPGGKVNKCKGTSDGNGHCSYNESCLNCTGGSSYAELEEVESAY
jgi:hypothetical protein